MLTTLFDAGVNAVLGDRAVEKSLLDQPLSADAPVYVLAVGKAASAMMQGVIHILPKPPVSGLMITKFGHTAEELNAITWLKVIESSHPVPNELSLEAGANAVEFIKRIPQDAQLLVLVSGGASALMEHLCEGLTLSDLQALNETLLAGGYPIGEMNAVRKTLSAIKGGKLAHYLPDIPVTQLVISDVPGDALSEIGSGPLAAPRGNDTKHPGDILRDTSVSVAPSCIACVNAFGVTPPAITHGVWSNIQSRIVASSDIAQEAVLSAARQRKNSSDVVASDLISADAIANGAITGDAKIERVGSLNGDVVEVAQKIAKALTQEKGHGIFVWGGETHCILPLQPGRGGRNQHLALLLAKHIAGYENISILCCGTDGSDGPTEDAGGLINGDTVAAGKALGLSVDDFIHRADAGTYLETVNGLITTGPTGTNVMDLVIAAISPK